MNLCTYDTSPPPKPRGRQSPQPTTRSSLCQKAQNTGVYVRPKTFWSRFLSWGPSTDCCCPASCSKSEIEAVQGFCRSPETPAVSETASYRLSWGWRSVGKGRIFFQFDHSQPKELRAHRIHGGCGRLERAGTFSSSIIANPGSLEPIESIFDRSMDSEPILAVGPILATAVCGAYHIIQVPGVPSWKRPHARSRGCAAVVHSPDQAHKKIQTNGPRTDRSSSYYVRS